MNKSDSLFLGAVFTVPLGGVIGFSLGALVFDSWLRALGCSALSALLAPVWTIGILYWLKPWKTGENDGKL